MSKPGTGLRLIGFFLLVVGLGAGAYLTYATIFATRTTPDDHGAHEDPKRPIDELSSLEPPPIDWATLDAERTVEVTLTASGPSFVDDQRTFQPTPILEGAEAPTWNIARDAGRTTITGQTMWRARPVEMSWVLEAGDPQAVFTMTASHIPMSLLSEPMVASFMLPKGQLAAIGDTLRREPVGPQGADITSWTPAWIRWGEEPGAATLVVEGADGVRITPGDDATRVELTLWHPAAHAPLSECDAGALKLPEIDLTARMVFAIGERQDIRTARLASGHQAAIAPVFVDPKQHPDRVLHDASAIDPQDWVTRATTLAFGYSTSDDPRYGNGGLLGTNLGGTLVVPQSFVGHPRVKAFIERMDRDRLDIAVGSAAVSGAARTFVTDRPSCADHFGRRDGGRTQTILGLGPQQDGGFANALNPKVPAALEESGGRSIPPSAHAELPSWATVPVLDGSRSMLLDQYLSRLYIQRLVRERGVVWMATPLVATRNPLTGSAASALLKPERRGQWTLAPEFAAVLGQVELVREQSPVLFAPVSTILEHWRRARGVLLSELADGSVLVTNPHEETISGFTLIAQGARSVRINREPATGQRVVTDDDGRTQLWFWWDLPKGTAHVVLHDVEREGALRPVYWRVQDP
ncbi:MAG: hypothetical protein AAGI01_00175 [Myxococcota bacterium]